MNDIATTYCEYRHLENGIHRFVVSGETRQAVDEFFDLRAKMQDDVTEAMPLTLIHLNMSRLPSINHVVARVRAFDALYPVHPPSRSAILYRRGMLIFLLNNFLNLFVRSKDKVMFFTDDQEQKAIAWLLDIDVIAT